MIEKYFTEDVPSVIPDFEERPEQIAMSKAVHKAMSRGENLLIEAGTGVGKTLAYLIPAAEHAIKNDTRVIVTTYSRTLQAQIIKKDLPVIKQIFPELKFEAAYGMSNYMCRRRAFMLQDKSPLFQEAGSAGNIIDFLNNAQGLRENSPFHISEEIWSSINRDRNQCGEESCEHFRKCHYWTMRRRLSKCHIVVVNHHLFFSDIVFGAKILPEASCVIFDEAHRLEEVMREMISRSFSTFSFSALLAEAADFIYGAGRGARKKEKNTNTALVKRAVDDFIRALLSEKELQLDKKNTALVDKDVSSHIDLHKHLAELLFVLKEKAEEAQSSDERKYADYLFGSLESSALTVKDWINRDNKKCFYWLEQEPDSNVNLWITPYSLNEDFEEKISNAYDSVIMTSATLAAGDDFSYIVNQFGVHSANMGVLKSPFDYKKQSILYLEKELPLPSEKEFTPALINRLQEVIEITGGATLILFTSIDLMKKSYEALKPKFRGIKFLMQGQFNAVKLIEKFREGPAVLFATSSFWQGVDIKGDALKCVVITKLPFEVPEHPLQKAIYRHVKEQGGNDFADIALPRAVFMLKQGFGRLIRGKDDRGAVIILDTRITKKTYGRSFIKSLPDAEITGDMDNVIRFFNK